MQAPKMATATTTRDQVLLMNDSYVKTGNFFSSETWVVSRPCPIPDCRTAWSMDRPKMLRSELTTSGEETGAARSVMKLADSGFDEFWSTFSTSSSWNPAFRWRPSSSEYQPIWKTTENVFTEISYQSILMTLKGSLPTYIAYDNFGIISRIPKLR